MKLFKKVHGHVWRPRNRKKGKIIHETWWLNWRWITPCEQRVQPGLSQPAWPHQWFKGCCLVIGQFLNITWHVSPCVAWTRHRRHVNTGDLYPVPRSPVQILQAVLCSCEACSRTRARGQARAGVGLLLMQTEFIYQLSIALISLKTKTLLPTNLQANNSALSAPKIKTEPIKIVKLFTIVIVYRICFRDSPMLEMVCTLALAPSVVSWRLVICFRVKVL